MAKGDNQSFAEFVAESVEAYNEWATESAIQAKRRVSWEIDSLNAVQPPTQKVQSS